MSTLRNAIQRRNHRERAQPLEREKWGLLEKKKDYSLRAKDYNAKEAKLRALRSKAQERNPDEFYFGMMSKKNQLSSETGMRTGVTKAKKLDKNEKKTLRIRDIAYVRMQRNMAKKQVEELETKLALASAWHENKQGRGGRKTVFADSEKERDELFRKHGGVDEDEDEEEDYDDEDLGDMDMGDFTRFDDEDIDLGDDDEEEEEDLSQLQQKISAKLVEAKKELKTWTEAEEQIVRQSNQLAGKPKFKVKERKR